MKLRATRTFGLRGQYLQLLWGYTGPHLDEGWTNEVEAPYRYGTCTVHRMGRLPLAVAVGRWQYRNAGPSDLHALLQQPDPDDDLLLSATKKRVV